MNGGPASRAVRSEQEVPTDILLGVEEEGGKTKDMSGQELSGVPITGVPSGVCAFGLI